MIKTCKLLRDRLCKLYDMLQPYLWTGLFFSRKAQRVANPLLYILYTVSFFTLVSQGLRWTLAVACLMFQAGVKQLNWNQPPLHSKWPQGGDAKHLPTAWWAGIWTPPTVPWTRYSLNHFALKGKKKKIRETFSASSHSRMENICLLSHLLCKYLVD